MTLQEILRLGAERHASDVHISVDRRPAFRIDGQVYVATDLAPMTADDIARQLAEVIDQPRLDALHTHKELDFPVDFEGIGRFRGNAGFDRGKLFLVFRRISVPSMEIDSLGLPSICKVLAMKHSGMIIVTGPSGSGKSTTLAAMIDYVNAQVNKRIVTLEDPIEYLFFDKRSVISQRELGEDTLSFDAGLIHALRQNPDIIMVGEMRDENTLSTALRAAETGHLVITTAHAPSASQAVDRIMDLFAERHQAQVRTQLAAVLEGVLYQKLLPRRTGEGLVPAVEVMLGSYAVRNIIREGKTHQLATAIQAGNDVGMQSFDRSLVQLFSRGYITEEVALEHCHHRKDIEGELRAARASLTAGAHPQANAPHFGPQTRSMPPLAGSASHRSTPPTP